MGSTSVEKNLTEGELIVKNMKSPFCDDETAAKWIDNAIKNAVDKAKRDEEDRIESLIANADQKKLADIVKMCRWKKLLKLSTVNVEVIDNSPVMNRAERRKKKKHAI